MPPEIFMTAIRAWRQLNPNREDAYMAVIPKQVADSMALEGDVVDIRFLEEHLPTV